MPLPLWLLGFLILSVAASNRRLIVFYFDVCGHGEIRRRLA